MAFLLDLHLPCQELSLAVTFLPLLPCAFDAALSPHGLGARAWHSDTDGHAPDLRGRSRADRRSGRIGCARSRPNAVPRRRHGPRGDAADEVGGWVPPAARTRRRRERRPLETPALNPEPRRFPRATSASGPGQSD